MDEAPEEFIDTPHDWMVPEVWDHYWQRIINNQESIYFHILPSCSFSPYTLAFLQQRKANRILFAGNGISLEPLAWAHAGFDVTVVDISPTASKFIMTQNYELSAHYCPQGGQLTVLTEDLFSHTPPACYDALFSIRSFQGFPRKKQVHLAARLYEWLRPGGFCLIETMNVGGEHRTALESAFLRAGFFEQGHTLRKMHKRLMSIPPDGREALKAELQAAIVQDKAEESGRLNRGEKMLQFVHGSG